METRDKIMQELRDFHEGSFMDIYKKYKIGLIDKEQYDREFKLREERQRDILKRLDKAS